MTNFFASPQGVPYQDIWNEMRRVSRVTSPNLLGVKTKLAAAGNIETQESFD